jgi:hypothetical protein
LTLFIVIGYTYTSHFAIASGWSWKGTAGPLA